MLPRPTQKFYLKQDTKSKYLQNSIPLYKYAKIGLILNSCALREPTPFYETFSFSTFHTLRQNTICTIFRWQQYKCIFSSAN